MESSRRKGEKVNPFPDNIKKISIPAPAGPVKKEILLSQILVIEDHSKAKIELKPHVFEGSPEKYYSAPECSRLADLNACYEDEETDMIFCARGGYGTALLLPLLNWDLIKRRNIPLLGYSDITALHLGMYSKGIRSCFVSPMAAKFSELEADEYSANSLKYALSKFYGQAGSCQFRMPDERTGLRTIKQGEAQGPLFAVNLAILCSLCGTEYMPDMSGAVLLVEDVGEAPHRLDRMMAQLKLCGILDKLGGLIYGQFTESGTSESVLELIRQRYASSVKGPVLADFPFGHGFPFFSSRFGTEIRITAESEIFLI